MNEATESTRYIRGTRAKSRGVAEEFSKLVARDSEYINAPPNLSR